MSDVDVHGHIEQLVAEEHRLLDDQSDEGATEDTRTRLAAIQVELDRYYDLLRQRRARADAGQDPDGARMRSESTVENYEQ